MKKLMVILSIAIGVVSPTFAKKVALLVGVGNIPSYELYTKKDIKTIKTLIGNKYDKVIVLEDNSATYENLKSKLEELYKLKKSDTLFFYYTGHGCRAEGSVDEKDSKDEFLMLWGVKFKKDEITIKSGIMLDDELNYHFSKIEAKKVIIFDCCHSQTMYKGISKLGSKYAKTFETIFKLGYKKNPMYKKSKNKNFINLSACLDFQQSEDSPWGGIFTLTLKKVLKERGNISLSRFIEEIKNNLHPVALKYGRAGDYVPNISSKGLNPSKFYTKDIFTLKKESKVETLESYLDNSKKGLKLLVHGETNKFTLGDSPILISTMKKSKEYLYLLEVDNNHYRKLAEKRVNECVDDEKMKECIFKDTVSTLPFGKAKIYLVATKYPLKIKNNNYGKDFGQTVRSQLKEIPFRVGETDVYAIPPK